VNPLVQLMYTNEIVKKDIKIIHAYTYLTFPLRKIKFEIQQTNFTLNENSIS
jgi:hypothetical protein